MSLFQDETFIFNYQKNVPRIPFQPETLQLSMTRKKWTAKDVVTDAVLKIREKRKWQQALRRYILEKNISEGYAVYFGLDVESFREWIEIQFTGSLDWNNFAEQWQFDHIVPIAYFDFNKDADLMLAWNFINIRVEKIDLNKARESRIDVIAAKPYFNALYNKTAYSVCAKMLQKIEQIEASNILPEPKLENFIIHRKQEFEIISSLNAAEFAQLNRGRLLDDILLEREILKKFG